MHKNNSYLLLLLSALFFTQATMAQNTGGVFPPMVNSEHKSLQYRAGVNPDNANSKTGFAQRLHYQQSLNSELMWRIIGQTRKTSSSQFDFDFVQAELFWELSNDEDTHKSGLRFDVRLRDKDRPDQLGVNWMNQFNFNNGWSARALLLTSIQAGSNAKDGVNIQSRGQIARRLQSGKTVGLELYNNYGNTGDFGGFDDQSHTLGPFISTPITERLSLFAGPLFGLSSSSPDVEFRLWLTQGF